MEKPLHLIRLITPTFLGRTCMTSLFLKSMVLRNSVSPLSKNTVLWSGKYYMTETHTATLSKGVSSQPNGIVLVWSRYIDGAEQNTDFIYTYVPKQHVSSYSGRGISCHGFQANGSNLMVKYVYITNTTVKGYEGNNAYDKSELNSGVYRTSNGWVLRQVVGV